MGVTRERPLKHRKNKGLLQREKKISTVVSGLNDLASFLNFNFNSERQDWQKHTHPLFLLLWRPGALGIQEVKKLQAELKKDLLPLVAPEPWQMGGLDAHSERLIEKINSLRLVNAWDIEPWDAAFLRQYHPPGWETYIDNLKQPIRPFERVVKIGGFNWLLRKSQTGDSIRARLYRVVVEALETGELVRLKKCDECIRFFVAKDPRLNVCSEGCERLRDNRGAKDRERRYRERKKEEKHRQFRQAAAHKPFKQFCEFMVIARKKTQTDAELARLKPILNAVGGWRVVSRWERPPDKDTWEKLPKETKQIFNTA